MNYDYMPLLIGLVGVFILGSICLIVALMKWIVGKIAYKFSPYNKKIEFLRKRVEKL
jgi:hypothetical protein